MQNAKFAIHRRKLKLRRRQHLRGRIASALGFDEAGLRLSQTPATAFLWV